MNITDVRVSPEPPGSRGRVLAYCSITIDDALAIHDIRLIAAGGGRRIVAMPDRKMADRCWRCVGKNRLTASYCNDCGAPLDPGRAPRRPDGRSLTHANVAHPVNNQSRNLIESAVLAAYRDEMDRPAAPNPEPRHARPTPA